MNNLPRNSLESNLAVIIIFFIFPFSFYCFTTLIYSKKVITDKKNAEFDSCIFSLLWIVELILLGIIFLFLLDGVFAEYINNEAEVFLFDYIMMYYLFGIAIVILLILKSIIHLYLIRYFIQENQKTMVKVKTVQLEFTKSVFLSYRWGNRFSLSVLYSYFFKLLPSLNSLMVLFKKSI